MYSYTKEEFIRHTGNDEIHKLFPVSLIFDLECITHDLLLNPGSVIAMRRFVKQLFACPFSNHIVSYIYCSLTVRFAIKNGYLKYDIVNITLFNNYAESEREFEMAKKNEVKLPITTPQWN